MMLIAAVVVGLIPLSDIRTASAETQTNLITEVRVLITDVQKKLLRTKI
jgi:hypothetical protein